MQTPFIYIYILSYKLIPTAEKLSVFFFFWLNLDLFVNSFKKNVILILKIEKYFKKQL